MLFARDFRQTARAALDQKWGVAIGTGFVAALLGGTGGSGGSGGGGSNSSSSWRESVNFFDTDLGQILLPFIIGAAAIVVVWAIAIFFIGGAIQLGYCRFNRNLIMNTEPRFKDLFSRFDIFWKGFGLRFVTGIFILLWTLLLIIPGIIAAFRYSMAFYIMDEDPSIGIMEAIDRSKEMMIGNKWRLFCLEISFIGWMLLSICTCGIGFLWLTPYMNAAVAAFYLEISGRNQYVQNQQTYVQY